MERIGIHNVSHHTHKATKPQTIMHPNRQSDLQSYRFFPRDLTLFDLLTSTLVGTGPSTISTSSSVSAFLLCLAPGLPVVLPSSIVSLVAVVDILFVEPGLCRADDTVPCADPLDLTDDAGDALLDPDPDPAEPERFCTGKTGNKPTSSNPSTLPVDDAAPSTCPSRYASSLVSRQSRL